MYVEQFIVTGKMRLTDFQDIHALILGKAITGIQAFAN